MQKYFCKNFKTGMTKSQSWISQAKSSGLNYLEDKFDKIIFSAGFFLIDSEMYLLSSGHSLENDHEGHRNIFKKGFTTKKNVLYWRVSTNIIKDEKFQRFFLTAQIQRNHTAGEKKWKLTWSQRSWKIEFRSDPDFYNQLFRNSQPCFLPIFGYS